MLTRLPSLRLQLFGRWPTYERQRRPCDQQRHIKPEKFEAPEPGPEVSPGLTGMSCGLPPQRSGKRHTAR